MYLKSSVYMNHVSFDRRDLSREASKVNHAAVIDDEIALVTVRDHAAVPKGVAWL